MGRVRQGVASAQQRVAPSTTEQPFEPDKPQALRKKGRDGASFGRVLEGLNGKSVPIGPLWRVTYFLCVFLVRLFVLNVSRTVTL